MPAGFPVIFDRLQSFARDLRKYPEAQAHAADADGSVVQQLFVGADWLAVHFRSRVLLALRATHVMVALMGITLLVYQYVPEPQWLLWMFLAVFAAGILLARVARRREWHRKYIDYRSLAEGLRVQWFWRRAGISATGDQNFAHDNFLQKQDVELGWIRNVMRFAGLQVTAPIDPGDVGHVCDEWVGEDDGSGSGGAELAWYTRRAIERSREERVTRVLGAVCLWTGIAICLLLALAYPRLPLPARNALEVALGTLSIIAAVRSAYAFRKADKELVRQYRFMQRIYRNARNALDACADWRQRQEILQVLGEATLAEHAEWALMHRERPLEHGKP
jgi:4-amino-4-deoxy-L-arabinose transferase-like glycosyltransferase